jgi:hypothetical protein
MALMMKDKTEMALIRQRTEVKNGENAENTKVF